MGEMRIVALLSYHVEGRVFIRIRVLMELENTRTFIKETRYCCSDPNQPSVVRRMYALFVPPPWAAPLARLLVFLPLWQ